MNSLNWDDLSSIIISGSVSVVSTTVAGADTVSVSTVVSKIVLVVVCAVAPDFIVAVIVGMRAAFDGRWLRDTTAAFDVAHSATNVQRAKSKEQYLLFIEKILSCRFIFFVCP